MRHYAVTIEVGGVQRSVGDVISDENGNAAFAYTEDYISIMNAASISLSLPLQKNRFTPQQTKNFFEGLLPEGFMRKSVAKQLNTDEENYISLLYALGQECVGAIRITDRDEAVEDSYEKLSAEQVRQLATGGTEKSAELVTKARVALTGASSKVGLYYDADHNEWYLPHGNAPSTHIVKQSHVRLDSIVINEQLCQMTAAAMGIPTPQSFIINMGDAHNNDILLATQRYDRVIDANSRAISGKACPHRLHQEDFAEALGIAAADKYERNDDSYLKLMFEVLRKYSADPIADQIILWKMVVYNFLVGNTDGHIKNFSLLYGKNLNNPRLAPAYDLISTTIYGGNTQHMSIRIGGEYEVSRIRSSDFYQAAEEIGLDAKTAMTYFREMCSCFEDALSKSTEHLVQMGYSKATQIQEKILLTGGYRSVQKGSF